LANGTLVLDLLEDFDYRSVVMEYGSGLEQVFAIFANILDCRRERPNKALLKGTNV
jgi:hypothetical protein